MTTLRKWRERFLRNRAQIRSLGYPDELVRMWEFYFCYREGGFQELVLGTAQMLLVKPKNRRDPLTMPIAGDARRGLDRGVADSISIDNY